MPLTPAEQKELAELEALDAQTKPKSSYQLMNEAAAQSVDRVRMQANPELQGPRLPEGPTPEEQQVHEGVLQGVAGGFYPEQTANVIKSIASGAKNLSGRLMNRAVGMKSAAPEIGAQIAEEGVVGTRGMMGRQIESRLGQRGQELEQAVEAIPGQIPNAPVASEVEQLATKYTTPEGNIVTGADPHLAKIKSAVDQILSRGESVSPKEAVRLKRGAQTMGYREGEAMPQLAGKIGQAEAGGYGQQLEQAYAERVGGPNKVASSNEKLTALLKGKQALSKAKETDTLGLGAAAASGMAAAGFKLATGHPEEAVVAGLATGLGAIGGKLAAPAIQSAASQAARGFGKVAGAAAPAGATLQKLSVLEALKKQREERE